MVRCYNLLAEIGKEDGFTAKEIEFLTAKGVRACVIELTHGCSLGKPARTRVKTRLSAR